MSRHRVHQYGGRVSGLAARHVETDRVDRRDALAEHAAIGVGDGPALLKLVLVELTDTLRRGLKRLLLVRGQRFESLQHLFTRNDGVFHRLQIQMIEAVRIFNHGFITAGRDVLHDRFRAPRNFRVNRSVPGHELLKLRLKILIKGG